MQANRSGTERITPEVVSKYLDSNTLDLSICRIRNIECLDTVKGLKVLNLGFNSLVGIGGLTALTELQELYLEHNLIERVSGLEKNRNLRVLNLTNNKIEKIEGISGLLRLQQLVMDGNRIAKLSGVQTQKLRVLSLNHNLIESLDFLPVSPNLQELYLSSNKISYVNNKLFNNTPRLQKLDVSHNQISNIKFVQYLKEIQELDASFNLIEDVNLKSPAQYLQALVLNNNQIQQLPYLQNLFPELMTLEVSNNFLSSEVGLIQSISNLASLVAINFRGNPMYAEGCEDKFAKVFGFETINEKQVGAPGDKYGNQIKEIMEEWKKYPELYMSEGSFDTKDITDMNEIRKDGFYDSDLEEELNGPRNQRLGLQQRVESPGDAESKYHQKMHQEIQQTNDRINYLKIMYQEILKKNSILAPDLSATPNTLQLPTQNPQTYPDPLLTSSKAGQEGRNVATNQNSRRPGRPLASTVAFSQLQRAAEAIRVERRVSTQKWQQIKNYEKLQDFKQARKKSLVRVVDQRPESKKQETRQKPNLSLPKIVPRAERHSSKMLRTQTNTFEVVAPTDKMNKTVYKRPPSAKKV